MTREPLSDRVRAAIVGDDPQLVREVEMLERIASAGVAHVAANGKHPRDWSIDRWISILGFVGVIIGGIWLAGVRWASVEHDIADVKRSIERLTENVERDRLTTAAEIQRLGDRIDGDTPSGPRVNRRPDGPTAAFPRDEQFVPQREP